MTQITFEQPPVAATARRGRPEIFNAEFQAALKAKPGEFAVLQAGVIGRSRVSALRARYKGQGFEFVGAVTEEGTRVNKNNETVKTETIKIYVRYVAPEVEAVAVDSEPEPVETPAEEVVNPQTPEEVAQADAEFEEAAPKPEPRKRASRAKGKEAAEAPTEG